MSDNQYYSEFKDRKELLNTSIDAGKEKNKTGEVYDENITVINDSIDKYNEKINKLNNVKQCIISRNNTFDQNDTYYYSIVKVIFHHMIIQHFNMTIKRMKPQWIHHNWQRWIQKKIRHCLILSLMRFQQ